MLVLDGTLMAGAGRAKSYLSLARDSGGTKAPYFKPLPGDLARTERSSSLKDPDGWLWWAGVRLTVPGLTCIGSPPSPESEEKPLAGWDETDPLPGPKMPV